MRIELTTRNFRSLGKVTWQLRPGVNILIGPNGSGKTNLLQSLLFLRNVLTRGVGLAVARAGGPLRVYRRGTSRLEFQLDVPFGTRIASQL